MKGEDVKIVSLVVMVLSPLFVIRLLGSMAAVQQVLRGGYAGLLPGWLTQSTGPWLSIFHPWCEAWLSHIYS